MEKEIDSWKPVSFIISIPVGVFLHTYIIKFKNKWPLNEIKNNNMNREESIRLDTIIRTSVNLINSIAFGLLVIGLYILFRKIKPFRHSHNI